MSLRIIPLRALFYRTWLEYLTKTAQDSHFILWSSFHTYTPSCQGMDRGGLRDHFVNTDFLGRGKRSDHFASAPARVAPRNQREVPGRAAGSSQGSELPRWPRSGRHGSALRVA